MDIPTDFDPMDLGQYFDGVDFPINKEEAVREAELNGAPQVVVEQLRKRLPEREFSSTDDVIESFHG